MTNIIQIDVISKILGHKFSRQDLVIKAFTHRSSSSRKKESYERLEFIGDRVLGLVIADMLLSHFPNEDEGALARRHTALVRAETLASVANDLNLGQYIVFGEETEEMRCNTNILSDVVEASIGALFRDKGLEAVVPFMEKNFRHRLKMEIKPPKDGKTTVQEWAQKKKLGLPIYTLAKQQGTDHAPVFSMAVYVDKHDPLLGTGKNKQVASQNAATNCIEKYGIE